MTWWTVAIGVDKHKQWHVAVALDRLGRFLGSLTVEATGAGYQQLLVWARSGTDQEPPFPLGVGMGLDAGEAVPTQGGYRGTSLNLAARLCALAKPGEILATETVARFAHRVDGLRLLEGRSATLKGMPRPVRYVVVEPEQPLPPVAQLAQRRSWARWLVAGVALAVVVVALAGG